MGSTTLRAGLLALAAAGSALAAPSTPAPVSVAVAPPAKPVSAAPVPPGSALEWVASHDDALSRAKKEKKLVLLDFYTDWCGWCKRLDKDVFADAGFQKAAAGVLAVKVNAEKLPDLARRYQVNSYPRLFFVNHDGVVVERIRGYLSLPDFTAKVQAVKRGDTEFARFRDAANDSRNVGAVVQFARMLVENGQHDQAIPYWQQVHDSALELIFQNPDQPGAMAWHREALVELGNCYAAVGMSDVAVQQYVEVLRNYPESPEAVRAVSGLGQVKAKSPTVKMPVPLLEQLAKSQKGSAVGVQAQALLQGARPAGGAQ